MNQLSRPQQQNLQAKITELENKTNKLIDIYLEGTITLKEYQRKKEFFINEKNCGKPCRILLLGTIIGSNRRRNL